MFCIRIQDTIFRIRYLCSVSVIPKVGHIPLLHYSGITYAYEEAASGTTGDMLTFLPDGTHEQPSKGNP